MTLRYTLYVDESGDLGLSNVRVRIDDKGASPFFSLGAALIPDSVRVDLRSELNGISKDFSKFLHCTKLNHLQKAYYSHRVGSMRVKLFGVLSKKATLGAYAEDLDENAKSQEYYNKNIHYLLEMVGGFCHEFDIPSSNLSVIFEEQRGHSYQRLRNYLSRIRAAPIDSRASRLRYIDPLSVTTLQKKDDTLMCLADLVAHSISTAFTETKTNYGLPEQRYLRELLPRFHHETESGCIANSGIKLVKGPFAMKLQGVSKDLALKLYHRNQTIAS